MRFFLLQFPIIILGVGTLSSLVLRHIDGLTTYREAWERYEPNFLGFLVICGAIYVALCLTGRFEVVGIGTLPDAEGRQAHGDQGS